jgi:hypothetical protein
MSDGLAQSRRVRKLCLLAEPGRQEAFDLPTGGRLLQAALDALPRDDRQRRRRADLEALDQIGALICIDLIQLERAVISSALEDLCEKALHAAAAAGGRRVEEDKTGLNLRAICGPGSPQADPALPTPIVASIAAASVRSSPKTRSSPVPCNSRTMRGSSATRMNFPFA